MPNDPEVFSKILALLRSRLGLDFSLYKAATLKRRIARRIVALKFASLEEYHAHLRKNATELRLLFEDLLIQVTGFFRDPFVFDLLKKKYLPSLLAEKDRHVLRIWVPACSTGEEVYSLAIVCSELLAKAGDRIRLQLFGTDVNDAVLATARSGFYPEALQKQISPTRFAQAFERVSGGFRIRKHIRELCVFAKHDVTADPPFSALDLISCRNFLIYLTPALQQKLMPVFHYALRPEGLLLLGASESVGRFNENFSCEDKRAKIFRRKPGVRRHRVHPPKPTDVLLQFPRPFSARISPPPPPTPRAPSVASLDALISRAVQKNLGAGEMARTVPLQLPHLSEKIYLVFVDGKAATDGEGSPTAKQAGPEIARLRRELQVTRDSLRDVSDQGEAVTEALRAAHEEVVSSNEELQSTNEELETAKEELQSTNEELTALNRELEDRNQELEKAFTISRHYTAIVESSEDAIVSKNLDGIIQTWNQGAQKIFGYAAEEVIGRPITILIPEDHIDEEPLILSRLRRGERIENYETLRRRKDGSIINVSLTVSPVKDATGRVVGASKIARDITFKKQAERALREARDEAERANHAKDEFLAALSHELRTPLNPVLLIASDAATNPDLPADVQSHFELVRRNVEIEVRLIDDLLDLTRIRSGKLKLEKRHLAIHDILRTTLEMLGNEIEQKQLTVRARFASGSPIVLGDEVRLQQVFWNVLKNAVKFTPPGGSITLQTKHSEKMFEVVFTDTGLGMTPEQLALAFDSFRSGNSDESQRSGGLGLGLTIGRRLVEMHNGTITAESEGPNYGSTFVIRLPLVDWQRPDAAPLTPARQPAPEKASVRPSRILLVDDHKPTRETLARLLAARKHTVRTAASVREALACAAAGNFDIIISDLGLPDGSGHQLFSKLKKQDPRLKGIALTGYGTEEDVSRTKNVGFDAHMTKPIRIQALDDTLDQLAR